MFREFIFGVVVVSRIHFWMFHEFGFVIIASSNFDLRSLSDLSEDEMDVENDMDLRAVNPKTDKMEAVLMSTPEGNDSGPSGDEDGSVSDHSCVGEPKKVPPGTLKLAALASATGGLPLSALHARASETSAAQMAEQEKADALLLQKVARSTLQQKSAELDKKKQEHTSAKDHMEPRAAKRAREAVAAVQEGLKPERTRRAVAETREHPGAVASKAAKREREQSAAKAARRAARQEERAAAEAKADAKLAKQERRAAKAADREREAAKAAHKLAKQDENAAAVGTAEEQSVAKATRRPDKAARKAAEQRAPEEQEEETLAVQEASKEVAIEEAKVVGDEGEAAELVPVIEQEMGPHLGAPAAAAGTDGEAAAADDSDGEAAATDENSGRPITSTLEAESEGEERHGKEDSKEDGKKEGDE